MGDFFPNRALIHRGPTAESFDRRLLACGFADFLLYAFLIYPLTCLNPSLFSLWSLTTPVAFLATCIPVGPLSAAYWRAHRAEIRQEAKVRDPEIETEAELLARRQRLVDLSRQAAQVQAELADNRPADLHLQAVFDSQIQQAKSTQARIDREVARIEVEIEKIRTNRIAAEIYLSQGS